jgi:HAD domain in Swiss Army Knife RNA repair proteins
VNGKLGGTTRRIGVALVAALAVVTGATDGDSQAQSLSLQIAQLQVPQITVPDPPVVTTPTVPVTPPPAPVPPAPVTPPPVRVDPPPVRPPAAPVKPVKPPSVPVKPPSVPVKPPRVNPAPVAPAPGRPPAAPGKPTVPGRPALPGRPSLPVDPTGGSGPSNPQLPSLPGGAPSGSGTSGRGGGGTLRSLIGRGGDLPAAVTGGGSTLPGDPVGGGGSTPVTPIPVAALTAAAPGIARVPSPSELAALPPAERREVVRRIWDTPLRKQRLRQLRTALAEHQGCLDMLSERGRRALLLRAGLGGRDPASRRVVARRLGTSLRGAVRLERSALRRLASAGERGLCGGGGGGGVATTLGGSQGSLGEGAAGDGSASDGDDLRGAPPAGDILADVHEGGPGVDLGDGKEGASESVLFFLLALLGPLAAIALATRRRAAHGAAAAAGDRDEPPLLFLDVDGVIALSPFSKKLPPGQLRELELGSNYYVPDRTGELVRQLANRFEIVWVTGWDNRANEDLLRLLGLTNGRPVTSFEKKSRYGWSKSEIKRVDRCAGHRPAAWLDHDFAAPHERWAAHRAEPTLLVPVNPRVGLSEQHVERLLSWADRHAAPAARAASANGGNGRGINGGNGGNGGGTNGGNGAKGASGTRRARAR